ncbi:zinc finger and BTB domain-containing protein 17 [Sarotherodon galilaeus]
MTNVQLGVVLLAICLSTQMVSWTAMAVSNNSTAMTAGGNSTYNGTTTTATDTFGAGIGSSAPRNPEKDERKRMDGWMDGWMDGFSRLSPYDSWDRLQRPPRP